ncbi:hypothetical protein [Bdellovibrio sp. BCCA]|uniref:hypothetical protein n=1 Tax=Bdellovibrio sp. BCCA TaxID=3136281 RepID=UPI0030F24794
MSLESIVLSTKEIRELYSKRRIEILRPLDIFLIPPCNDAYFDRYNKGSQWSWWTKDNKQSLSQVVNSPFFEGQTLWIKETFSTSFTCMYPCPKAWYKTDFFGRFDEPRDPVHIKGCPGNFSDCAACAQEREGNFKWSGPSKMPKELSRFTLRVEKVEVVVGKKSFWKVALTSLDW